MAERHVVPQNLDLLTGFVLDDGERGVGVGRLGVVVHLEIFELGASDDVLLLLDGQGVPLRHVVEVLLDDDVTAACEIRILVTDGDRDVSGLPGRVLGTVDKTHEVALLEILEPVDFVDHRRGPGQPVGHDRGELEAQVHLTGPDVKQQIARRARGVVFVTGQLDERMQFRRPWTVEKSIPRIRTDAYDAAKPPAGTRNPIERCSPEISARTS